MEDFLIIQIDVRTRMQYLGLPLANLDIFDEMLDDRSFRLAMIDYNEKIEYAIGRFAVAIKDSINDIQKGKEAVGALWHYIGRLEREDNSSGNLNAICGAMLANIEGWNAAFRKLNKKGISLDSALVKLGMAVVEMQRRVGVASRRSVVRHKIIDQYNCSDVSSNVKQMPFSKPPNVPSQGKPTPKWNERERPTTVFGFGESDKPLPRDPDLLEAVRRSPATGESRSRRIMTKSVPNLRNANKSHYHDEEAKGLANKKSRAESGGDRAPSKPQRSFSKAILKSTHAKEFVGRGTEETQSRPATAPARTTLKSRSISLDHLKTLCALRKTHQETLSRSSISPARQVATPAVTRRDILKNQVLHYVRSDKVDEAWEASVNGEKKTSRRPLQKKLDWPLSIFRARSSTNRHVGETRRSAVLTNGLGGKMTWLEEDPGALNTYSLKPKRDESPRIPVPSPQLTPAESEEEVNGEEAETGSLITALPSMSHPLMNGQAPDAGHGQATENIAQPLGLVS